MPKFNDRVTDIRKPIRIMAEALANENYEYPGRGCTRRRQPEKWIPSDDRCGVRDDDLRCADGKALVRDAGHGHQPYERCRVSCICDSFNRCLAGCHLRQAPQGWLHPSALAPAVGAATTDVRWDWAHWHRAVCGTVHAPSTRTKRRIFLPLLRAMSGWPHPGSGHTHPHAFPFGASSTWTSSPVVTLLP